MSTFVTAADDDTDVLWALSDANFPFRTDLMETLTQISIRGRTWAMAESTNDFDVGAYELTLSQQFGDRTLPLRPPLVVYQHTEKAKQLIVLTAQGVHVIERRRPVEVLQLMLLEYGADSREVASLFSLQQADQCCAMCLVLICASGAQGGSSAVVDAALRAFFVYGGDARVTFPATQNGIDSNLDWSRNGSIADWTHNMRSPVHASTPQQSPPSTMGAFSSPKAATTTSPRDRMLRRPFSAGPYGDELQQAGAAATPQVVYSHRHNGMYLYLARLLGPLWEMRMCVQRKNAIESAFSGEELAWFASQLSSYRDAIDAHSLLPRPAYSTVSGGHSGNINSRLIGFMRQGDGDGLTSRANMAKQYQVEAANEERQSLLRLYELTSRSAEVLWLWKIISDHLFHVVVAQLPNDIQRLLLDIPFSQLVTAGKELCSDLITCLIRQYLGDRATTDAISARLRKVCPSIYSSDDAQIAKATELVQQARGMEEGEQKARLLKQALNMFKEVVDRIHLPTICLLFQDALCFDAIVDLVLCAAEKADPQQLALAVYRNADVVDDGDSLATRAFSARASCYTCVTETLNQLADRGATALDSQLTEQSAVLHSDSIIQTILSSNDELAHVTIFNWMLERSMSERMLQSKSPFLEQYLRLRVEQDGAHRYLDLLWRFYEKQGRHLQAAQLLFKLAERHNAQTDLKQRLSYLSHAVMCAQAAPDAASVKNAEFVQELKDKLEVARIQNMTRDALQQMRTRDAAITREATARLNAELFDVTTLYSDFADKFDLPDVKLAIVHCAGHFDQPLIESLWKEIIDKETSAGAQESSDVRSKRLATKLVQLGRLYSASPRYFPTDYVCRLLQRKSFECGFAPTWLPKVTRALNIGQGTLLEILHKQYRSRDPLWKGNRQALTHLMNTVLKIINEFIDSAMDLPSGERRAMSTKCLDVIATFMMELSTALSDLTRLKQQFQEKQLVLDRISAA